MLVLVSFVLVLAAAVTLVVGLLQSGLTLIYLSIGCSVLAGVVLAVAVLRGRPEPKAAPVGRPYTPPATAPPVPASVGAPSMATTGSYTPPPPPPPAAPPAPRATDDAAAKAAGTALLGRLRRNRGDDAPADVVVPPASTEAPSAEAELATAAMPAVTAEADDGFPIADYDKLRATDLLRRLGTLDRNQLEAVRDRETAGKNRFTILSRVDTLLEAMADPAWDVADDDWDSDADAGVAAAGTTVIAMGPADDEAAFAAGEMEDDEADEVDVEEVELVSPTADFPIAGYDSLTVGQILPRLSELAAGELAQVRGREQQGRARGTILDRVDRLASKAAPMAMPAAAPARKAPARKVPARKAPARKASVAKAAPIPVPPATSTVPARRPRKAAPAGRKAAAPEIAPPSETVKKAAGRKKAAAPVPAPAARKSAARKAAPEAAGAPMKAAVKKARAAKRP